MFRTAALRKAKETSITIGNVTSQIKTASSPFISTGYLQDLIRQDEKTTLEHLKWMLSKDKLGQDIFLIGPPGIYRRHLALAFSEMVNREIEIVTLSSDTTESDLKQRREISVTKSALFIDQPPVKAALNGSLLLLDGIQNAERNVLPLLNNLLENREMNLEDGRLLVSHSRYTELSQNYAPRSNIVPTHPDFRVIALGLPIPPFVGNTLDPPLRSRFQARRVENPSAGAIYSSVFDGIGSVGEISNNIAKKLSSLSGAMTAVSDASGGGGEGIRPPTFPSSKLMETGKILSAFDKENPRSVALGLYPFADVNVTELQLNESQKKGRSSFNLAAEKLSLGKTGEEENLAVYDLKTVTRDSTDPSVADLTFTSHDSKSTASVAVACGPLPVTSTNSEKFTPTAPHASALTRMLQYHYGSSDILLLSDKGTGKSALANEFAHVLGFRSNLFSLYKDMTSRDLLMRRSTDVDGATIWEPSPLILSAINGDVCVLDGIEKLPSDALQTLQSLLTDREIQLPNGERMLRSDRFDLASVNGSTGGNGSAVQAIHPSFRVIALGTMSGADSGKQTSKFIKDETLPMFQTIFLPPPTNATIREILKEQFPKMTSALVERLLIFNDILSSDNARDAGVAQLSLRNIIRVAKKVSVDNERMSSEAQVSQLHAAIHSVLMTDLLPRHHQDVVNKLLSDATINKGEDSFELTTEANKILFDNLKASAAASVLDNIANPIANPELIPSPKFFDIPQHIQTINSIVSDIKGGEQSLLLIGNQGVGKNKIADRVLQLLHTEREYIQLHRDSTVGQLTLSPNLVDGKIVWEDSPLVKAIVNGRTLMIDEADKAPLEVVAVLKSLVEDKEMRLADGRRIVTKEQADLEAANPNFDSTNVLPIHPDFKMFVLANRPGFPFLGNDFFREIGDCFAAHAIPNPDIESEKMLLKSYASKTPDAILHKLASAFAELRKLSDAGDIAYPYSTREAVATAKHLEKYPEDGLVNALANVLHFDSFDELLYKQLVAVFNRHGIPLPPSYDGKREGGEGFQIQIAKSIKLSDPTKILWAPSKTKSTFTLDLDYSPIDSSPFNLTAPVTTPFVPTEHRIENFTHLVRSWEANSSKNSYSDATELATLGTSTKEVGGDSGIDGETTHPTVHVLTTNPITIHNYFNTTNTTLDSTRSLIDLEGSLPYYLPQQPSPLMCGMEKSRNLMVFFPSGNLIIVVDPVTGLSRYSTLPPNPSSVAAESAASGFFGRSKPKVKANVTNWRICEDLVQSQSRVILYEQGGSDIGLLDFDERPLNKRQGKKDDLSSARWLSMGDNVVIDKVTCASSNTYFVHTKLGDDKKGMWRLDLSGGELVRVTASEVSVEAGLDNMEFSDAMLSPKHMQVGDIDIKARGMLSEDSAFVTGLDIIGDPSQLPTLYVTPRPTNLEEAYISLPNSSFADGTNFISARTLASTQSDIIEVVDTENYGLRQINLVDKTAVKMKKLTSDYVAVLDHKGLVNIYEVGESSLQDELNSFRQMLGLPDQTVPDGEGMKSLTLNYGGDRDGEGESWKPPALKDPKFGEWDDKNEEHVGGSNWAGGTGGSNTAGLGGRGGPYRLDRGHKVHQVSDEAKAEVSEESKKVAKEMARKGLEDKLQSINMGEAEYEMYENLVKPIRADIASLRNVLNNAEAKTVERSWLKRQSQGELDDAKLVDGVTGEKFVFKKRGTPPAEPGAVMKSAKRIRFVMDCSGSMYRFNSQDGRLDRSLEAAALIMEAFAGSEHRFDYSIVGHSGDSPAIPLVNFGSQPKTEADRMKVLRTMVAHTQFCSSGDYTLESIVQAKMDVAIDSDDADEYVVVAVSDANLRRYRISPEMLKNAVDNKPGNHQHPVRTYAIFIASLGSEAEEIKKTLGVGRGYVCQNTNMLPKVMREILSNLRSE